MNNLIRFICRILPGGLFGRLMVVLAGGMTLALLASAAIHFYDRGQALYTAGSLQTAQRIADVIQLLDPMSDAERRSIAAVLKTPLQTIQFSQGEPAQAESEGRNQQSAFVQALLEHYLGGRWWVRVTTVATTAGLLLPPLRLESDDTPTNDETPPAGGPPPSISGRTDGTSAPTRSARASVSPSAPTASPPGGSRLPATNPASGPDNLAPDNAGVGSGSGGYPFPMTGSTFGGYPAGMIGPGLIPIPYPLGIPGFGPGFGSGYPPGGMPGPFPPPGLYPPGLPGAGSTPAGFPSNIANSGNPAGSLASPPPGATPSTLAAGGQNPGSGRGAGSASQPSNALPGNSSAVFQPGGQNPGAGFGNNPALFPPNARPGTNPPGFPPTGQGPGYGVNPAGFPPAPP
nr:hypothetical protein [Magnetococcales bacterium]